MIVACPGCKRRLRLKRTVSRRKLLAVHCPHCQTKFKVRSETAALKALIAHEDERICQQISERIALLGFEAAVCHDDEEILPHLLPEQPCALLLDVAFNGAFPFQLIDNIKAAGNQEHKVILLPSVYNRTAYKKNPESLYGADAYLELHHIGDRLVPLLGELFPTLANQVAKVSPVEVSGDERSLTEDDVAVQADKLAKLLVADIVLYHGDRLEQGLEAGQLDQLFAEQLAEGRRLLLLRLPAAGVLETDFIQQAFDAVCQSYSNN